MLVNDLNSAQSKLDQLRRMVESCEHNFCTSPVSLGSHTHRDDFNQPNGSCYVAVRTRGCGKCGLEQRQIEFRPGDGFTEWKNTNC